MNPYLYRRISAVRRLVFNGTACKVPDIVNGGGTTFECYDDGEYTEDLPTAGTGFLAIFSGTSAFRNVVGDTLESYPVGDFVASVPGEGATGFSALFSGTSQLFNVAQDNFESYPDGVLTDGTPPVATGFTSFFVG